ncbi:MAG: aminoglycoside phosphotransferase family protein [Actinomycetota bacterium]
MPERAFALPPRLVEAARFDSTGHLTDWIATLPATIDVLRSLWRLDLGPVMLPGGAGSWVAPLVGRDLVLKVAFRHVEADGEVAMLRLLDGRGAVRLVDDWSDDSTVALLLERCRPGHTLGETVPEEGQDRIVCDLLARVWATQANSTFRVLERMCAYWAEQFEDKIERGIGAMDRHLADDGLRVWRALASEPSADALLCTDLHAGNILAAQREPWLLIDPKPHLGDPAYDVLQHMLNCDERLRADPVALCRRMAALTELDADRVSGWLFARCVIEGLDRPWLQDVARMLAR